VKDLTRIILASASPRRLELLRSLRLEVDVIPSRYREPSIDRFTPSELASVHAREKALEVRLRADHAPIVAADTIVDLDGTALGKPRDAADAARMLGLLSGREHIVHSAFALMDSTRDAIFEHCESTRVTFFKLGDREIADYVESGEPMDKAGAYGIQGFGATLVERIDGDFYTVMGFPLAHFVRASRRMGFLLHPAKNADIIK